MILRCDLWLQLVGLAINLLGVLLIIAAEPALRGKEGEMVQGFLGPNREDWPVLILKHPRRFHGGLYATVFGFMLQMMGVAFALWK